MKNINKLYINFISLVFIELTVYLHYARKSIIDKVWTQSNFLFHTALLSNLCLVLIFFILKMRKKILFQCIIIAKNSSTKKKCIPEAAAASLSPQLFVFKERIYFNGRLKSRETKEIFEK